MEQEAKKNVSCFKKSFLDMLAFDFQNAYFEIIEFVKWVH
jgi:hypothetical protein